MVRRAGPQGKRKLRRGPLTRRLILDASLRLFSQKGFAPTSVRDIAQAAGITDAAIYYHFTSKRALFEALFEERGITSALAELEQISVTNPPLETFAAIALRALEIMHRNRDFLRVLFTGALGQDRVAMEEYRGIVTRWANAEARIIRDYMAEGQLRPVDVEAAARQLVFLVITTFVDHVMSARGGVRGDTPPPALVRQVELGVDYLVRGLRP